VDSLDWSRTYEVLSMSRRYLVHELGFPTEQVRMLTDEDMERIAQDVRNGSEIGFDEDVKVATAAVLGEKGEQDGEEEPLRQNGEA
jgi:hypothetical protein